MTLPTENFEIKDIRNFKDMDCSKPEIARQAMIQLMELDSFNQYCVDCMKHWATHADLDYGVFLCKPCARQHQLLLGSDDMSVHSIRTGIFREKDVKKFMGKNGGNRMFYLWLRKYNLLKSSVEEKYNSTPGLFFRRCLEFKARGLDFKEKAPSSTYWREQEKEQMEQEEQLEKPLVYKH